jgi:DNA-binding NtrC family response regulator
MSAFVSEKIFMILFFDETTDWFRYDWIIGGNQFRGYGASVSGSDSGYEEEGERRAENPSADPDELLLDKIGSYGYTRYKRMRVKRWEKRLLERLLRLTGGNKSALARRLRLDRSNVIRKIKEASN